MFELREPFCYHLGSRAMQPFELVIQRAHRLVIQGSGEFFQRSLESGELLERGFPDYKRGLIRREVMFIVLQLRQKAVRSRAVRRLNCLAARSTLVLFERRIEQTQGPWCAPAVRDVIHKPSVIPPDRRASRQTRNPPPDSNRAGRPRHRSACADDALLRYRLPRGDHGERVVEAQRIHPAQVPLFITAARLFEHQAAGVLYCRLRRYWLGA